MLNEQIIKEIFENNFENIENNIQLEYHQKINKINIKNKEERNDIKLSIISELYYKEGFKDGINYMIKILDKK